MLQTRHRLRRVPMLAACALALAGCGGGGSDGSSSAVPPSTATLGDGIDAVVKPYMAANGITAVTVAVVKDGQVLYEHGYGYLDAGGTIPLPASALMTTASIVKPVTAAAIQTLAEAGSLHLEDHVFCTGRNMPCWMPSDLLSPGSDPRAGDITIGQLLAMQGGFDRSVTPDPDAEEANIQAAYGLSTPPQPADDIRYRMALPLDFAPGSAQVYSNFDYMLLGQIIEKASGMSYTQYVNTAILSPLGVAPEDFIVAAPQLKDRSPREPDYICDVTGPSLFDPGATVAWDDGMLNLPTWEAAGYAVTTPRAMALVAGRYTIDISVHNGVPLSGKPTVQGAWDGEVCGTQSTIVQRPSGASFSVFMNKWSAGSDLYATAMRDQIGEVLLRHGL